MKKRKQQDIPCNQDFYETGSTKPPKKSGGVIAFLLAIRVLMPPQAKTQEFLQLVFFGASVIKRSF